MYICQYSDIDVCKYDNITRILPCLSDSVGGVFQVVRARHQRVHAAAGLALLWPLLGTEVHRHRGNILS